MLSRLFWASKALETALTLAWARFLIKFLPFSMWRRTVGQIETDGAPVISTATPEQRKIARMIGERVRRCARHMPFKAVCLPQAMAARWMLNRRGIATTLFFGARRGKENSRSEMHAWLMCGEDCLTGVKEVEEFRSFTKEATRVS